MTTQPLTGWAALGPLARRLVQVPWPDGDHSLGSWLWMGLCGQRWGITAGLLATWSLCAPALWLAAVGAEVGAALAIGATIVQSVHSGAVSPFTAGGTQALDLVGVLAVTVAGALGGFGLLYGGSLVVLPGQLLSWLITGALIAAALTGVTAIGEPLLLRLRGYRRLSWDERERVLPLYVGAAQAMGLETTRLPDLLVRDVYTINAAAHLQTIVLTRALLTMLTDDEIAGILVHELHHWRAGHVIGNHLVWACACPLATIQDIGVWLESVPFGAVVLVPWWAVFWPSAAVIRFVVAPVQAHYSRVHEYAADAAADAAGAVYRDGLKSALIKHRAFEVGRTGWEAVILAGHPPTELRLERLVSPEEAAHRAAVVRGRAAQESGPSGPDASADAAGAAGRVL